MLNTKAQGIGPVTFIFSIVFTLVIIGLAGGQIFGLWTVATPSWIASQPVENFFLSNAPFFTIFGLMLGIIGYYYFGGGR